MSAKQTPISAIHEDDATRLLDLLGLTQAAAEGTLRCQVCNNSLRAADIGAVTSSGDQVVVVCTRLECLHDFRQHA